MVTAVGESVPATQNNISHTSSKKRKRSSGPENDTPAARRIQMKKSLVKELVRGKTLNANKKKGKLGGVIKTAIKKANAKNKAFKKR